MSYWWCVCLSWQLNFYCLKRREQGISLLEKAANASHSNATFALAIIKFNGSGGGEESKDLRAGIKLCERATILGHQGAYAELIMCNALGYGVERNERACRLLKEVRVFDNYLNCDSTNKIVKALSMGFSKLPRGNELKLCSNIGCRRPETRKDEFRRCPGIRCRKEFFCSYICSLLGHTCTFWLVLWKPYLFITFPCKLNGFVMTIIHILLDDLFAYILLYYYFVDVIC